jgi:hypothetical protein
MFFCEVLVCDDLVVLTLSKMLSLLLLMPGMTHGIFASLLSKAWIIS